MASLSELRPKEVSVDVELKGGRGVTLTLRPFTLADQVFFNEYFESEDNLKKLADMNIKTLAEFIWPQLDADSKLFFADIKFEDIDAAGNKFHKKITNYMSLVHGLNAEKDFHLLFNAFLQCQGLNGFVDESMRVGVKKKDSGSSAVDWGELFDFFASQYGYTPDQIFGLTPFQIQVMSAKAGIRTHNDLQRQIALRGGKPDYIDQETENMLNDIKRKNKGENISAENDIIKNKLAEIQKKKAKK